MNNRISPSCNLQSGFLKKRILLLSFILITTLFWLFKAQNLKFTFKEANLLPDYHQENIIYNEFTSHFGDEGNSIVIGIKDSISFLFTNNKF